MRRGLVDSREIVDAGVAVRAAPGPHHNFRVEGGSGRAYFVKRPARTSGGAGLAHEASVCSALATADAAVAACVPRVVDHDPVAQMLVMDLVPGALDLRTHFARAGAISADIGGAVGWALAALHGAPSEAMAMAPGPWALMGFRPSPTALRDLSPAGRELIRILQSTELPAQLEGLRRSWRSPALIHNDISPSNALVAPAGHRPGRALVTLVDWEVAGRGDPDWDVGSALACLLSLAIFAFSAPTASASGLPGIADAPLERMKPALRACWRSYASGLDVSAEAVRSRLLRATAYAGARLVQAAFESAQSMDRLSRGAILHLQAAANILARPEEAVTVLLGLEA
jgi:aminoglycoside phosphotransferase (APT) family kinase protein